MSSIKIKFDKANNAETPTFILAEKSGKKLGKLDAKEIIIKDSLDTPEISFKVHKNLDDKIDLLWGLLTDYKCCWCRDWDMWFELNVDINEEDDTVKLVSGKRLGDVELSQTNLYGVEINTEKDIARDDYEKTLFYNPNNKGASLLDRILNKNPNYTVQHVDTSLMNIWKVFSFDNKSVKDCFSEVADEVHCVFVYNSNSTEDGKINRTISVYDLENTCLSCGERGEFTHKCTKCGGTDIKMGYGDDTTIFVSSEDLANNIQLTTNYDTRKNCFRLSAGDDLMNAAIKSYNPNGSNYIWYIADDIKKNMTKELVSKLEEYDEIYKFYSNDYVFKLDENIRYKYNQLVEKYSVYKEGLTLIPEEIKGYPLLLTILYNIIDMEILIKSSLMPGIVIPTTTAKDEADKLRTTVFSTVAVEDVSNLSSFTANNVVLNYAKALINSNYKVKVDKYEYDNCNWLGNFIITSYSDEEDTYTTENIRVSINDDYERFIKQKLDIILKKKDNEDVSIIGLFKKSIVEFEGELKKYCITSLNNFYSICQSCLDVLMENGVGNREAWKGNTPDLYTELYEPYLNKLNLIQRETNIKTNDYNALTGAYDIDDHLIEKGVETYISDEIEKIQDILCFEDYLGNDAYLEFCSYKREDTYENSNYVSTGLSNTELFDNAKLFYESAQKELVKAAELQHSITCSLKNLLAIKKFEPLINYFKIGNWLRIKIDDDIFKLRLISYEIQYDNLLDINVEFSDVTKTLDGMSDAQSLLDKMTSISTSYGAVVNQVNKNTDGSLVVNNWLGNGLDLTNMKIVSSMDNQEFLQDEHGLLVRSYDFLTDDYLPCQLKMGNSTIAITDDNWETIKTAIGRFYYIDPVTGEQKMGYGINSEVLIGRLILGEQLGLYSSDGSATMSFDNNGLVLNAKSYDGVYKKIFDIQKDGKSQLYVDNKGNIVLDTEQIKEMDNNLSDNYYNKEEMASQFKVNNEKITAEVSKTCVSKETFDSLGVGGRNLIILSTSTENKRIDINNGNIITANDYIVTDWITVDPSTSYAFQHTVDVAWYDKDKKFISATTESSKEQYLIMSPNNAAFMCVDFETKNKDRTKVEKGTLYTDWTPAPEDQEDYVEEQLKSYSTTEEMKSAIDLSASGVLSTVSKTYTTTKEVEKMTNVATTVTNDYSTVLLEKAANQSCIPEIHIYGNNNYGGKYANISVYNKDTKVLNEYNPNIASVLKKTTDGEYTDEYVNIDGYAYVIRRVNDDGTYMGKEVIEPITKEVDGELVDALPIPLTKGDSNFITTMTQGNGTWVSIKVIYFTESQYTDYLTTKVETVSQIKQTADSILLKVEQKADKNNIIATLNVAVEDGQGVVAMKGNAISIETVDDRFHLTKEGDLKATSGVIGGWTLANGAFTSTACILTPSGSINTNWALQINPKKGYKSGYPAFGIMNNGSCYGYSFNVYAPQDKSSNGQITIWDTQGATGTEISGGTIKTGWIRGGYATNVGGTDFCFKGYAMHGGIPNPKGGNDTSGDKWVDSHMYNCNWTGTKLDFFVDGKWSAEVQASGSDKRLKDDIIPINDELLNAIEKVQIKTFYMIEDETKQTRIGIIAQDLIEAFKEQGLNYEDYNCIYKRGKSLEGQPYQEYFFLDYDQINTLKIACLERKAQKQQEEISDLKDRLNAIEELLKDSLNK